MYLQATSDTLVLPTLVQDAIINSNPMGLPTIHPQVWVWRKHEARDQNKPPWSESPGHLPSCSSPWGAGERWIDHDKSGENQRASLIRAAVAREKTSRELELQAEKETVCLKEQNPARKNLREKVIIGAFGWILIYSLK